MNDVLVAFTAGVLGHAQAARLNLDRIVKLAGGEGKRMKEAVLGFGEILGQKSGRRVTIVAGRDRAMTGFDPTIEMVLHDMAVGARSRVVSQIGCAVGIGKGESAEPCGRAENKRKQNCEKNREFARRFDRATRFHARYVKQRGRIRL